MKPYEGIVFGDAINSLLPGLCGDCHLRAELSWAPLPMFSYGQALEASVFPAWMIEADSVD
jgi:hypothetical protein